MKGKNLWFYITTIGITGFLIWSCMQRGKLLEVNKVINNSIIHQGQSNLWQDLTHNLQHSLSILILQIIVIIIVARIFTIFFKRIGQPAVIGEILAGIVLGPSLLGWLMPDVSAFLFPAASLNNLQFLSQIGLILFMFVIGLELDTSVLKKQAHEALVISHSSIIFPFLLGVILSYFIYEQFAPDNIPFLAFALFMGIAMSITAFPVLARIVQERGLTRTSLGTMVITCAAVDDVTAWCLLALVIAIVKAGAVGPALITFLLSIGYVIFMFYILQPLMKRIGERYSSKEMVSRSVVALIFIILLVSSWMTEVIGIHALFGAFMAGVIIPDGSNFKRIIADKIEDIALVLFLPLFFVFTGIRTQIGLLDQSNYWVVCAAIVGVAVLGKLGGGALSARFVGQSWRNALSIGVLMNARGLMELIILNIGYDLGVLSPEIFAMMVIMALVTTFMTGPGLDVINRFLPEKSLKIPTYFGKVLMSFGKPEMGASLLRLSEMLTSKKKSQIEYTAMHISPHYDIFPEEAEIFEKESFTPIRQEAQKRNVSLNTFYKATEDVTDEIINFSKEQEPDILLLGAAQSLFNDDLLGGKIGRILNVTDCDTLVFSDRGLESVNNLLVIYYDLNDNFLLYYIRLIHENKPSIQVSILNLSSESAEKLREYWVPLNVQVLERQLLDKHFLNGFDLVIINKTKWEKIIETHSTWVKHCPSLLVIKQGTAQNKLLERNDAVQMSNK
ncbi:MAG: cation:proton antiporter [Saprospiraceae bacterium]|nr:cation:proton antiporter [Saprospiraceae bacterium]